MSKEVKQQEEQNTVMPAIALRGLTVFPHVLIHFEVSRELSVKALEQAMTAGSPVFLVGQRDISVESPREQDLYQVGTIANIRQILRMPGGPDPGQHGEADQQRSLAGGRGPGDPGGDPRPGHGPDRGADARHL